MAKIIKSRIEELFREYNGRLFNRTYRSSNQPIGSEAGTTLNCGHWQIRIDGKYHRRSKIIWILNGGILAEGEILHHKDRIKDNDKIGNLQKFISQKAHRIHHVEEDALDASGDKNWRKCCFCHKYDDIKNMHLADKSKRYHNICENKYKRRRRKLKNEHRH